MLFIHIKKLLKGCSFFNVTMSLRWVGWGVLITEDKYIEYHEYTALIETTKEYIDWVVYPNIT